MTIEQIIKLGDDLKAFVPETTRISTYEAPPSVIPPGCPLYINISGACELFSIGENTMRTLIKNHADFPALRIGKKIVVDVPGLYAWLHDRNGQTLNDE